MSKGLNLINTSIRELYLLRKGNDAEVRVLYEIEDDAGNLVKSVNYFVLFSAFPNDIKAPLNISLRLISKEINNTAVNENKESWTDI